MLLIDTRAALLNPATGPDPIGDWVINNQERARLHNSRTAQRARDQGIDIDIAMDADAPVMPPTDNKAQEIDDSYLLSNTELDASDFAPPLHQQKGYVWNQASQEMHDWHFKVGLYEEDKTGKYFNKNWLARNPKEVSQFGLEYGGVAMYSDMGNVNMLSQLLDGEDELPDSVAMARLILLGEYDKLPAGTWAGTFRMMRHMAANPTTIGTFGSLSLIRNLAVRGGKKTLANSLRQRLWDNLLSKAGVTGRAALKYGTIPTETALIGAFFDHVGQRARWDEEQQGPFQPNWQQTMMVAGITGAVGGAIQGVVPAVKAGVGVVRGIRERVRDAADASILPRTMGAGKRDAGDVTLGMGAGPTEIITPGAAPDRTTFTLERFEAPKGASVRSKKLITRIKEHPEVIDEVSTLVRQGEEVGRKWYDTEELRIRMIGELGEETGDAAWREFMLLVGATSTGAKVPTNIRVGSHYFTLGQKELNALADELLAGDYKPPKGYGHKMQRHQAANVGKATTGQWGPGSDPTLNPKPRGFTQSLMGGTKNIAADVHFMRLMGKLSEDPQFLHGSAEVGQAFVSELRKKFGKEIDKFITQRSVGEKIQYNFNAMKAVREGPKELFEFIKDKPTIWSDMPNKNEYKIFEQLANEMAKELNMTAPQFQAALWMGAGKRTGVDAASLDTFMGIFNRNLELRAKERGITPEEVFKRFVNRTEPLLVPLAAAGGAVSQMPEEET